MSSTAKKIIRQREKKLQEEMKKQAGEKVIEIDELIEKEKYADAVDIIADLAKAATMNADIAYRAAYCYFMCGDYTRASKWIENTFYYDKGHKKARILLGRICIMEDRADDAFTIFEFVLEHYLDGLSQEEKEEMEDVLDYYGRIERDNLVAHYPLISKFLGLVEDTAAKEEKKEEAASGKEEPVKKPSLTITKLSDLKAKLAAAAGETKEKIAAATDAAKENLATAAGETKEKIVAATGAAKENISQWAAEKKAEKEQLVAEKKGELAEKAASGADSIMATLAKMKEKLKAAAAEAKAAKEEKPETAEEKVMAPAAETDEEKAAEEAAAPEKTEAGAPAGENKAEASPITPKAIMEKAIPLAAKLKLLNYFAAAHFVEGKLEEAAQFLEEAIAIDDSDEVTLKNLAILKLEQGDEKAALKFASLLPQADFSLLYLLKNR